MDRQVDRRVEDQEEAVKTGVREAEEEVAVVVVVMMVGMKGFSG